ncbi:MAG: SDR family oxidoreductase [Acidobacteriaceae bacterium]
MSDKRFENKVAVVIGGAQGVGKALALRLAREGASVIVADRQADKAEEVAEECRKLGKAAKSVEMDLRDSACGTDLVTGTVAAYGRLDLCAFCAGVAAIRYWLDIPLDEWDTMMSVNARGAFICLQAIARQMIAQGDGGAIVTLASPSGQGPRPDAAHYGASKAALIHLTRTIALDLARYHIRVNGVSPGIIDTAMWKGVLHERAGMQGISTEEYAKNVYASVPLGVPAQPEWIAGLVAFLLSDEAGYITGQIINQDGGYTLQVP